MYNSARSGSKKYLQKILKFHGKPLIYYAIKKHLDKNFNKIIVSTDSTKIAKISIECGLKFLI